MSGVQGHTLAAAADATGQGQLPRWFDSTKWNQIHSHQLPQQLAL